MGTGEYLYGVSDWGIFILAYKWEEQARLFPDFEGGFLLESSFYRRYMWTHTNMNGRKPWVKIYPGLFMTGN